MSRQEPREIELRPAPPPPGPAIPICPGCHQPMPRITWNANAGPQGTLLIFMCASCRTCLGCQVVPAERRVILPGNGRR